MSLGLCAVVCLFLLLHTSEALYHGPRRVQPCTDQMTNWAAEIRCLRNLLQRCDRQYSFFANHKELRKYSYDDDDTLEPTTSAVTLSPGSPNHPVDVTQNTEKELDRMKERMTHEFNAKLVELESRVGQELLAMEERANTKIEEIKRKSENEIRELNKLIKLMTRRVSRFEGKEYIFMDDKENWYAAKDNCLKWGGHLATVNSEAENEYIKNLHNRFAWIGINDIQKEGEHVWVDGSNTRFRRWKDGQPDNLDHNENCVEQDDQGTWSDRFCFLARYYVCER
uniref:C-type lectin domain-containing protein n=1 Tax=Steinernema glaseri TaxID=37863 RepID=A0A1I7ZBY3_9BILA